MEIIDVPRPKSVRDPNRAVSGLLLAQVKHLRQAEMNLPPKYQSGIFIHAIQTEGEAARYVRAVTEAIHAAHDDAAAERVRNAGKPDDGLSIAAGADEDAPRNRPSSSKGKAKGGRSGRKK